MAVTLLLILVGVWLVTATVVGDLPGRLLALRPTA